MDSSPPKTTDDAPEESDYEQEDPQHYEISGRSIPATAHGPNGRGRTFRIDDTDDAIEQHQEGRCHEPEAGGQFDSTQTPGFQIRTDHGPISRIEVLRRLALKLSRSSPALAPSQAKAAWSETVATWARVFKVRNGTRER